MISSCIRRNFRIQLHLIILWTTTDRIDIKKWKKQAEIDGELWDVVEHTAKECHQNSSKLRNESHVPKRHQVE